jgi:hypothetical protein
MEIQQEPKVSSQFMPNKSLVPYRQSFLKRVILKMFQSHIDRRSLLNGSQFVFHGQHSMILQCMRLMNHVT